MNDAFVALVAGALVINEVLYDPPGPDAGWEFVEIFNPTDTPQPLAGVEIEVGDGARPGAWRSAWSGAGDALLGPGELLLVSGDSLAAAQRLGVDLQNGPDAVRLRRATQVLDVVGYGELAFGEYFEGRPAHDVSGASLARLPDGRDGDDNGADLAAAPPSPGRRNRPLHAVSLRLEPPDPQRAWPGRRLAARVQVHNAGLLALGAGAWRVQAGLRTVVGEPYRDPVQMGATRALEWSGPPSALAAGDSLVLEVGWNAVPGLFALDITARLDADSLAPGATAQAWVRVGAGPVLVDEILYAPAAGGVEWIEVWNRDARPHDLNGWTLADAAARPARLAAAGPLAAGSRALVSADSTAAIPGLAPGTLRVVAAPWPALNNSDSDDGFAEHLVLRDPAGVVHDALRYAAAWGGERGRSLERLGADPDVRGLAWAVCKAPAGSTPGAANSATGLPRVHAGLQLMPNPFSPDGDGRDELVGIALEVPIGWDGFRASVFDLDGRRRRVLGGDRLGPGPRQLVWDGSGDEGQPLPSGVYIVHIELYSKSSPGWRERRVVGLVRP